MTQGTPEVTVTTPPPPIGTLETHRYFRTEKSYYDGQVTLPFPTEQW